MDKSACEQEKRKWRGGIIVGFGFHSEFPIATLTIGEKRLSLEFPFQQFCGGPFIFLLKDVFKISHHPFFSFLLEAVQIHHSNMYYPSYIAFLCSYRSLKKITDELARAGYTVET